MNRVPIFLLVLVFQTPTLSAQVGARQATQQEVAEAERGRAAAAAVEVPNPMLLEVKLQRKNGSNALAAVDNGGNGLLLTFSTNETSKFTVDRAHVERVWVQLEKPKKKAKKIPVEIGAYLKTGWFRQDVDVTLSLIDADGKLVTKKFWDDETIGDTAGFAYGGVPKELKMELKLDPAEYERLSAPDRANTLRIVVEVQGEKGDEDDD